MRGRSSKKPEAYSLEYVEDFSSRERRRCPHIVCRSRTALLGQTPMVFVRRASAFHRPRAYRSGAPSR
jgi:hypothetical protein